MKMHSSLRFQWLPLALAASFLLTAGLASQEAEARPLEPSDIASLERVREVAISPDGRTTAYTLMVPRDPFAQKDGPAWLELHVLRADGTHRKYISGQRTIRSIQWTPDGRHISFLEKAAGDKRPALYVMPHDGGEPRRIVEHGASISAYDWNPDGTRVAFLAKDPTPGEKKTRKDQGFSQLVYEESAQNTRVWVTSTIVSAGQSSILLQPAETAEPRALTLPGSASNLHWSPDGDFIAVALAPTALIDDHYMNRKVHVVPVETSQVRGRIATAGKLGVVEWRPAGAPIALVAAADRHDPSAGRLMVAPRAGGAPVAVLPGFEGEVARIAWRDKDTLLYLASDSVERMIGQVGRDGSNNAELVATGGPILEGWSFTPDASRAALVGHSPEHPSEVYLWSPGDAHVSRATHHNLWLGDIDFGKQEVVRYQAIDGTLIDGLLIHPVKRKKTQRVPLIVQVHGGPESHYRNGWLTYYSMPGQVAAGRNIAVFYPNYRGSTGRGVAFSKTSQGDPAGREFDDIVDGIDHLVETGLVDPRRVASVGGSYGGYASAWAATYYTDRYAASAVFVGVTDLVSKIGTTDIPQEMHLVHYLKDPWTDWQFFLERSPIYHAGKSRTPTLILHGDRDPRVHPSQGLELYRHLKLRGSAPVRLVLYPGEGHGNRRAASQVDAMLRILGWFEHYLKGPGGDAPDHELDYNEGLGRKN